MTNSYSVSLCCPLIEPEPWAQALSQTLTEADVHIWPRSQELADYAVTWSPTQAFFDQQTQLKAVFTLSAGVDSLLRLKLPSNIVLVRIEDGGMGQQMTDYVTHALIRHFRQFDRYEQETRTGLWRQYGAVDFSEITVGIMGLGELGKQIAQRVHSLGFAARGFSRSPKKLPGISCYSLHELDEFLKPCHALVCALPLTPDTHGILNLRTLSQLKQGAVLINVARGAQVVESDLLSLLASGQINAAYLDVLCQEPPAADHALLMHPRVRITPHIAAFSLLKPSIAQISEKIRALRAGQPITGTVQRGRGY